jgi:hypothetical protein
VTTVQRRHAIACAGNWIVDQAYIASRGLATGDLARVGRPAVGVSGGATGKPRR